jgi:hypothetical protein
MSPTAFARRGFPPPDAADSNEDTQIATGSDFRLCMDAARIDAIDKLCRVGFDPK